MQYLNWKVSLIAKTYPLSKNVAVLLHYQKLIWKVLILLHTGQNECSVLTTAVSLNLQLISKYASIFHLYFEATMIWIELLLEEFLKLSLWSIKQDFVGKNAG